MLNSGVKVDPLTGRPLEQVTAERESANENQQEAMLKEQADWFDVTKTEAGAKIIALVEGKLTARIDTLIKDDPEAAAYVKILQEMGIKEGLARAATKQLFERFIKKE
jgi:ribosomal protein S25